MYQLVIDSDRCVCCGNCEAILPGLLGTFQAGKLLVSETNMAAHRAKINQAINSCHLDALALEEVG